MAPIHGLRTDNLRGDLFGGVASSLMFHEQMADMQKRSIAEIAEHRAPDLGDEARAILGRHRTRTGAMHRAEHLLSGSPTATE